MSSTYLTMRMHNMFSDLPPVILGNFLIKFVTIKDIGRLDSAFCSHSERQKLMVTLCMPGLHCIADFQSISNVARCMKWSLLRRIRFHAVKFTSNALVPQEVLARFFVANRCQLQNVQEGLQFSAQAVMAMTNTVNAYVKLTGLEIHDTLDPSMVVRLLQKAPNLERFVVHGKSITQSYFISACCPKVTAVKLSGEFCDENLYGMITCFPNLRSIEVDTHLIPATSLVHIIVSQPQLTSLSVRDNPSLTDRHMGFVAAACPLLQIVNIRSCKTLTNKAVVSLCTHCTQLESLALDCNEVTTDVLTVVANTLHGTLRHFSIAGCSKVSAGYVADVKICTLLESLDLCKINNSQYTAALPTLFQCLVLLRTLKLDKLYVKDDVLCSIAQHCTHIVYLSIVAAWGFTEVGIVAMVCKAKMLRTLVVSKTSTLFNSLAIAVIHATSPRMRIETV